MQQADSKDYYYRRAEEERAAAERAIDDRAARMHRDLADQYEKLANGGSEGSGSDEEQFPGTLPRDFRILP